MARGDANAGSDLDLLVDLPPPNAGNPLLRVAGMSEEFSEVVDAASMWTTALLPDDVSSTALSDALRV